MTQYTKKFADEWPGFECFEVINVLSSSNEDDRTSSCCDTGGANSNM